MSGRIAQSRSDHNGSGPVAVTMVAHHVGGIGGMDRQLEHLVLHLADLGHDVLVIARRCELLPHPRVRWIRVRGPARPFAIAFPWFFVRGSALVARHRCGIVHVAGAIVANRADIATVHLCHRALPPDASAHRGRRRSPAYKSNAVIARLLSRMAETWCYRPGRLDAIVGVSSGTAEEVRRFFPRLADRPTVVPNAVDPLVFHPVSQDERAVIRRDLGLEQDRLTAVFIGGDWHRKGLRFAVDAVAQRPDWSLVVVGGGDRARYEELARSLGAAERVRFIAPTPEIVPLYQAADAFLFPSAYEAFSLATLEAAACGLPLLATAVSGAEDLVEDGVNGWFIRQDTDDIASRLGDLAADPSRRATMGRAARKASERYSWEEVALAYSKLYQRLAGDRAVPVEEQAGVRG